MPHMLENSNHEEWHRYFAMEANNRGWELAVQTRSANEDRAVVLKTFNQEPAPCNTVSLGADHQPLNNRGITSSGLGKR